MHELSKMRISVRNKLNNLRNIDYLISTSSFESLWAISEDDMKKSLRDILEKEDKNRFMNWIKNHPSIELGEKSVGDLKEIARDLRIPNYSRLTKIQLLIKIKDSENIPKSELLSTENMVSDMMRLLDEMEPMFMEAGIPDDYLMVTPEMQYIESTLIVEAHGWIHKIYLNEYRKLKRVYDLLSPEMWERYRTWEDFGDHREVVLFNEAATLLKKTVVTNERPVIFKKSKVRGLIDKIKKAKEEMDERRRDYRQTEQIGKTGE
jgi:hypothetical protein